MKKLIVFDLDDTLAESKQLISHEMIKLLTNLTRKYRVAIISGCNFEQFKNQVLSHNCTDVGVLYLMPTSGAQLYVKDEFSEAWVCEYSLELNPEQSAQIIYALYNLMGQPIWKKPKKLWGHQIEHRGAQITLSAIGQKAPPAEKKKYDPNFAKRSQYVEHLMKLIPQFEIRMGGSTSVDVCLPGRDKAAGIADLLKYLVVEEEQIGQEEILFIGDAIFPGGNDYSVKKAGYETIQVSSPEQTKKEIEKLLYGN